MKEIGARRDPEREEERNPEREQQRSRVCMYGSGGSKVTETQGEKGRDAKGGQTSQRTQRKGRDTESPNICSWRQRDETETQREAIRETWRQEPEEVCLTLLKSCHRLSLLH